jgi:sirohydrochlorin cobaltochelatase
VSALAQERALGNWLTTGLRCIGQIAIESRGDGMFLLTHRDDSARNDLTPHNGAEHAIELARFDDAGNYRPLKTAPNLRHGWKLAVPDLAELRLALDHFYPGRLAAFFAFEQDQLTLTPFRETLERQSGMYRIAAQIMEERADELIGSFCRSDGGCLRAILWQRDKLGTLPSTKLPREKFDPQHDQTGASGSVIPLLCQEACNLLVAEARRVVQTGR